MAGLLRKTTWQPIELLHLQHQKSIKPTKEETTKQHRNKAIPGFSTIVRDTKGITTRSLWGQRPNHPIQPNNQLPCGTNCTNRYNGQRMDNHQRTKSTNHDTTQTTPNETAHQHLHSGTHFGECIGLSCRANSPATVDLLLLQGLSLILNFFFIFFFLAPRPTVTCGFITDP